MFSKILDRTFDLFKYRVFSECINPFIIFTTALPGFWKLSGCQKKGQHRLGREPIEDSSMRRLLAPAASFPCLTVSLSPSLSTLTS